MARRGRILGRLTDVIPKVLFTLLTNRMKIIRKKSLLWKKSRKSLKIIATVTVNIRRIEAVICFLSVISPWLLFLKRLLVDLQDCWYVIRVFKELDYTLILGFVLVDTRRWNRMWNLGLKSRLMIAFYVSSPYWECFQAVIFSGCIASKMSWVLRL